MNTIKIKENKILKKYMKKFFFLESKNPIKPNEITKEIQFHVKIYEKFKNFILENSWLALCFLAQIQIRIIFAKSKRQKGGNSKMVTDRQTNRHSRLI